MLTSGSRLGAYEILSPLGAGGMGEVYRARDTRLDRAVAVKVVGDALAGDAEAKQRFQREARAISALSHPHICALFDVGEHAGTAYLVLEFLEGETLADRIKRGPLPLEQLLQIGAQIADALHAAHKRGIVHRDLKPGNVMLTSAGAKLLDFGLATWRSPAPDHLRSVDVTREAGITARGTILGTYHYMAPEQIEGRDADARTDIFALGVVLYEMATGTRAFDGQTPASLFGSIMRDQPQPIAELRATTPPALDWVVRTCLHKDPEARFQSAHDIKLQLHVLAHDVAMPARTSDVSRRRPMLPWAIATLAVVAAAALAILSRPAATPLAPVIRLTMSPPTGYRFANPISAPNQVLSPDGQSVAFVVVDSGGEPHIAVQQLDELDARIVIAGRGPFWSPDGRTIGFFSEGKLQSVPIAGGPPRVLCDTPALYGAHWSPQGVILFSAAGPIMRVSDTGGVAEPVTKLSPLLNVNGHPFLLPDGRHFVYTAGRPRPNEPPVWLWMASLDGDEQVPLFPTDSKAIYLDGHLFHRLSGALVARPFDVQRLEVTGEPFVVVERVRGSTADASAAFELSQSGNLTYRGGGVEESQLTWFDESGRELATVGEPSAIDGFALSPDATRIAFHRHVDPGGGDLWIMDARGGTSRFTFDAMRHDVSPCWTADGSWIGYVSGLRARADVNRRPANGSGDETLLHGIELPGAHYITDCQSNDEWVVQVRNEASIDLYRLRLERPNVLEPMLTSRFNERWGQRSPDGRWLVFHSDETGRSEVFVTGYGSPDKRQVSNGGGSHAFWHPDGKSVFYIGLDGTLTSVAIHAEGASIRGELPRALFKTPANLLTGPATGHRPVLTPDGKRFLINVPVREDDESFVVVVNFLEEFRRRHQ
jgi:serine/threonine protein kinase